MPATSKGYSAEDHADVPRLSLTQREELAVALFLTRTDQLLVVVLAALVVCLGYIALG